MHSMLNGMWPSPFEKVSVEAENVDERKRATRGMGPRPPGRRPVLGPGDRFVPYLRT